jgi:hypothetical protein
MDENLPFVSQVKTHGSTSFTLRLYLPVKAIHENVTSFSDHRCLVVKENAIYFSDNVDPENQ